MKRLIPLILAIAFITACNSNSESPDVGTNKEKGLPDTIKIDALANRDMLIILSIMPDSIIKSVNWSREQRTYMRESVEQKGYFVDSVNTFKAVKTFKNNHLRFSMADGEFALSTYQIREGHYMIVTEEKIKEKQHVHAYELYKDAAATVDLEFIFGKYALTFLKDASSQSCLGMLHDKNPDFNFSISDDDKVRITMKNYTKGNDQGCLKGNHLVLKFNKVQAPFDTEQISWAD